MRIWATPVSHAKVHNREPTRQPWAQNSESELEVDYEGDDDDAQTQGQRNPHSTPLPHPTPPNNQTPKQSTSLAPSTNASQLEHQATFTGDPLSGTSNDERIVPTKRLRWDKNVMGDSRSQPRGSKLTRSPAIAYGEESRDREFQQQERLLAMLAENDKSVGRDASVAESASADAELFDYKHGCAGDDFARKCERRIESIERHGTHCSRRLRSGRHRLSISHSRGGVVKNQGGSPNGLGSLPQA